VSPLVALLRLGLGVLLLWAAATKLPDMAAFAETVANYRLLPPALVAAAAAAVVGVELVAGALLLAGRHARAAALVAAVLLAAFAGALALALARGIDLRCGCFGGQETATWLTVLRDLALLAAAVAVAIAGPGRLLGGRGQRAAAPGPGAAAPRSAKRFPRRWLSRHMSGHRDGKGHGGGHRHAHGHGGHGHAGGGAGGHGGHGGRDRHGNPDDFDHYLARLEDPERAAWQKPDEVVAALGLAEGAVACDLGTGPGVFAIRLARAVGEAGRVHAIDVEPRMLELLARRAKEAGVTNVQAHLAAEGEIALPPEPCDLVLVVNAFHHFASAGALRRLAGALKPGGRIANVDFHDGELPVGPPPEHRLSRAAFLALAREAGLELAEEKSFLPYQYFLLLRRAPAR
jgi:ubiquinone/menaquinone biosynthesis C-methylase UbiE/uncharacterized membrane protein YphA (DoxX/SURF4 family)